jgi:hypothetical protein
MSSLYIYYRVQAGHAARLAPMIRAMQAELGSGMVLRRPEEKDGLQTWMEVYADAEADFCARLDAAVRATGLMQYIEGPRHLETFVELPSCA